MKNTKRMFVMRAKLGSDDTTLMSRKRKNMMMSMTMRSTIPIDDLPACFTLPRHNSRSPAVSMSCHSVYL